MTVTCSLVRALAIAVLVLANGGCASDGDGDVADPHPSATPAPTPATATPLPIEGRWEQEHTCRQLVEALRRAGLGELAPAVAGDYFPGLSVAELASRSDLCEGAQPQRHAHFFDAGGRFGSLDQDDQQVDDGPYSVVGDILTIGEGDDAAQFRVTVADETMTLRPLITGADRAAALAHPEGFSKAGWQVAVTYGGLEFHRVPCEGWC